MADEADKPLEPRQQRFVDEYLISLNGTAAYLIAYPNVKNEATARTNASRLLTKANIIAAIEAARTKTAAKVELTQEWVVERLMREADEKGEGSSHSARVRAVELCGKHLGMLRDTVVVDHKGEIVVRTLGGEASVNDL